MLIYDSATHHLSATTGGYRLEGQPIRDTFVRLGHSMFGMRCIMYEPVVPVENSKIGIVVIHSDDDYSQFPVGGELAKRGYRTLCGQVGNPKATLDEKMRNIASAVSFFRDYPGIEKVILLGHSGGATLMSAYQAAAENGAQIFKGEHMLFNCGIDEQLPAADGLMTLDSNWGNGSMTLISMDPAVVEEGNGVKIDPELDAFNPANGYDPEGHTCYSEAFLQRFYQAQADRNNKIAAKALERVHALAHGKGYYVDDEPFVVTGAAQFGPCNKIFPEDLRFIRHTKEPHTLLHKDGSSTFETVYSVRKARRITPVTGQTFSCVIDTVRSYLTNRVVLAGEDYGARPDEMHGICWEQTYNCTPGNIRHVHVPLLVMGMTGSYEYLASEVIYQNAGSQDKSIAFMEGAGHNFDNRGDETYGDTQKVVFDYVDQWISTPGRFLS